jgi:hypothetical protein
MFLAASAAISVLVTCSPGAVQAAPTRDAAAASSLPATTPLKNRPQFHGTNAVVQAIEQVGSRVVVAGTDITSYSQGNGQVVKSAGAGLTATAPGDPTRIAWTGPAGGQWWSLLPDPDGRHVYAGSSTGVAKYDLQTGTRDWFRSLGKSTTIEWVPGTSYLIVGGYFKGGIAVIRSDTGATAPYTVPTLSSGHIYHADVQPAGKHWVGVGTFSKVGGLARSEVVMLTLNPTGAVVTNWDAPIAHGPGGATPCSTRFTSYLHDVAFMRDGSAFFVDGTGGQDNGICDSVSRFDMSNLSMNAAPQWITGTCTDTFWSVGVAPDDSYLLVGGHFKCIGVHHNPTRGSFSSRFGLAALDPATGNVLPWKSDKCRWVGTREISWVQGGVAIGYDCPFWGNSETVNPQPTKQIPRDRFAVLPIS